MQTTYAFLRELAATWMLIGMFVVFIVAVIWAFRPGSRQLHSDISNIPFRNEDAPAEDPR